MKTLLVLVLVALAASPFTVQAQTCDSPFPRLFAGWDWDFPYLAQAVVQAFDSKVCPGYNGLSTCCDQGVYDALAVAWIKLYDETIAVKADLDFLLIEQTAINNALNDLLNFINNDNNLTQDQKTALTTYVTAVLNAINTLINSIESDFPVCYSTVLKFYAGLLCKVCDPTWNDWITLVNGSNPAVVAWELHFAKEVCTGFGASCGPFFGAFWTYEASIVAATVQLLESIPGFNISAYASVNTSVQIPCHNASECLTYVCYKFLGGVFRRIDYGAGGATSRRRNFFRMTDEIERTYGNDGLTGTFYDGTFNALTVNTGLNTAVPSSSPASTLMSFWTWLLL